MTDQAQATRPLGTPRVVAVTGAAGYIGRQMVERLLASDDVKHVIGIDVRPLAMEHEKLTFLQQDITEPLDTVFRRHRVEAVVHLAFVLRQLRNRAESRRINVGGSSNVLWASEAAGVRRIVLMSSSTVYGPHPENAGPLSEDAPLRPPKAFNYARDKAECDWFYRRFQEQRQGIDVSILRGCVVMGPNVHNFITQALDRRLLIGVGREDPAMQFLHEEDLLEALWRFVSESHPGTFNIAGPGTLTWSEVVSIAHKRLLRFSAPVAYAITNLAWKLHLQNDAPGAGLDYIRWPWIVDTALLEKELDFRFKYTSREAIEAYFGPSASDSDEDQPGADAGQEEPVQEAEE
jgi:UDP-glucose 4-epimerase